MEYNDQHRSFLLNISYASCLKQNEALEMYCGIFGDEDATVEDMTASIELINTKLRPLDQKIVLFNSEQQNNRYVVFANADTSELMTTQSVYSQAEVELFKKLLIQIAKNAEHRTTPISALNLSVDGAKKLTKKRTEELISKWTEEGLFCLLNDYLYLGPRGIVEFGPYLRLHYPDEVNTCKLCKEPVFTGITCDQCVTLLHETCLRKYLTRMTKCPNCKKQWNVPL